MGTPGKATRVDAGQNLDTEVLFFLVFGIYCEYKQCTCVYLFKIFLCICIYTHIYTHSLLYPHNQIFRKCSIHEICQLTVVGQVVLG